MNAEHVALNALYVPLVFYVGKATYQWGKLLIGVLRRREFVAVRHEPLIALVLMMVVFFGENLYYGIARTSQELFIALSFFAPAVSIFKFLITLAAIIALDSYYRAVNGHSELWPRVMTGIGMWGAAMIAFLLAT